MVGGGGCLVGNFGKASQNIITSKDCIYHRSCSNKNIFKQLNSFSPILSFFIGTHNNHRNRKKNVNEIKNWLSVSAANVIIGQKTTTIVETLTYCGNTFFFC